MVAYNKFATLCFVVLMVFAPLNCFSSDKSVRCSSVVDECSLDDWLSAPSSITMCFQRLDISCDNGRVWTKIFDAKKIGGIEINLIDLDKNVDLSSVKGLRFGMLNKNTLYSCARALVSSVIIVPENGVPCNASKIVEEEGVDLASMYIRGTDLCPGEVLSPTFIPFETTDSSTIDLRFNGEISVEGFPKFTLKPITLDDSERQGISDEEIFRSVEVDVENIN